MDNLTTMLECIECKKSFQIDASNVKQTTAEYEGKKLNIIYVDCHHCGNRHYVQIDDEESSKIKIQNLTMFKKLSKKKLSGKDIGKSENRVFKNLRKELLDLRTNLMKEYEGKTVTDTITGESITLHFTFC